MRRVASVMLCWACSSGADVVVVDAGVDVHQEAEATEASTPDVVTGDAADASNGCFESTGVWGTCMSTSDCAALGAYTSTPGLCPGPADIQCCAKTPNVADDPPVPAGWKLMQQADVTTAMTNWAVAILNDPTTYPMFAATTQTFGSLLVMARVEWHPPDFQNAAVHRGVTLYEQTD
ncbi:MAG TPA: hypothetical protein VGH87_21415 [Polyangiaceae bacterium]